LTENGTRDTFLPKGCAASVAAAREDDDPAEERAGLLSLGFALNEPANLPLRRGTSSLVTD
jgi:hypothetical protein